MASRWFRGPIFDLLNAQTHLLFQIFHIIFQRIAEISVRSQKNVFPHPSRNTILFWSLFESKERAWSFAFWKDSRRYFKVLVSKS